MIKQLSEQNVHDINAILTAATILEETVAKHTNIDEQQLHATLLKIEYGIVAAVLKVLKYEGTF
jgi:hypothetical protein